MSLSCKLPFVMQGTRMHSNHVNITYEYARVIMHIKIHPK